MYAQNAPAILSRKLFALDVVVGCEVRLAVGAGVHLRWQHATTKDRILESQLGQQTRHEEEERAVSLALRWSQERSAGWFNKRAASCRRSDHSRQTGRLVTVGVHTTPSLGALQQRAFALRIASSRPQSREGRVCCCGRTILVSNPSLKGIGKEGVCLTAPLSFS